MRARSLPLATLVVACAGPPTEEPSATTPRTLDEKGWIVLLADDPQIFGTLMDSGARGGWAAFHKNDFATAAQLFQDQPIPRARAYLELAIYQNDLARLSREATLRTYALWEEKSGIPEGSALPVVAALAAAESGDDAGCAAWLKKAKPRDPNVQALAARLETRLSAWTEPQVAEGPLVACVWAHLQARSTGESLLLGEACPTGPLVTEQATDHLRTFYNPMVHGTEAAVALRSAAVALRAAGVDDAVATDPATSAIDVDALARAAGEQDHALDALLFSPWWTREDVIHDVEDDPSLRTAGAQGPSLQALGVHGPVPKEESIEWARGRARTLSAQLDRWQKAELPKGDGLQLIDELQVVRQYEGKVLLAWARGALDEGRPHEALTFAQMALDAERSREITPVNGPGLYAVLAEADLRTGRTRESLDALEVLTTRFPEVEGLDETVGDLAILQGLDRQGDSKEELVSVLRGFPLVLFSIATASAGAFRYAEDQAPAIVNPLFTTTMSEARMNELVFESLFTDDRDLATTPLLAQSTQVSEDRTQMLVHLRKDVRWHDGQPFTAADVVFTIQAMGDRGTLSTESGRVEWIKEVDAVDDNTVKIVFKRPEGSPEDKLFFKILPAHLFQGTAIKRTDPFRNDPVGTGPYKLTSYNDDSSITLDRADGYRNPAGLDQVVMREVSDKNYQAKLLLYESLEALVRVLPRDLAVLQNNKKVELYPYQTNSWWYLGFNEKQPLLADANLRHALCQLIDVESLLAPVGTGDVLSGPFVKSSPFYNHDVAPYAHDPAGAAQLLERAGYRRSGDHWTKNGQPLELHLSAHKSLESSQEVVINLQSQLQSQGISLDVEFLDDATWKAQIWRERDYDLILSQWSFDRNEDVREQFHSRGSRNFTGYANPQVDRLLDVARDTTDPQEKKQALRQLHKIVHDDAPMDFLWTLDSYSAMNVKVRGVVIHPFYFFTWMRDWQMQ